jgi:inner membrane protein
MLTPTHLVSAQSAYLGACILAAHPPSLAEAFAALGGALLPDLDSRQSYIGRVLPFLSAPIEHWVGHRTLSHSLLAQLALGALAWWTLPFGYFLALLAGWLSHSWIDMLNPSGVAWFWPSRARCVLPGNVRYRFATLTRAELTLLILMGLVGVLLMPLARTGEGTTGLIRSALGRIVEARQQYDAKKGTHAFRLEVRGRDNRTFGDVSGTYPVIGPYQNDGFILATQDGPRSVCLSEGCDWHSAYASLTQGAAETTTTRTLAAGRVGAKALRSALAPLETAGNVYLLGTITTPRLNDAPPAVTRSGEVVTLWYANPDVLDSLGTATLRAVDLSVQVRHRPGVTVPELAPAPSTSAALHPLLQRWLNAP